MPAAARREREARIQAVEVREAELRHQAEVAREEALARALAAEGREPELRRELETVRDTVELRLQAMEVRADSMLAQARADAEERVEAERRIIEALAKERDRLVE